MTVYEPIVKLEEFSLEKNSHTIILNSVATLKYKDECYITLSDSSSNDVSLIPFEVTLSNENGQIQCFSIETLINRRDKRKYFIDFVSEKETFSFNEVQISIADERFSFLKKPKINFCLSNVYS